MIITTKQPPVTLCMQMLDNIIHQKIIKEDGGMRQKKEALGQETLTGARHSGKHPFYEVIVRKILKRNIYTVC